MDRKPTKREMMDMSRDVTEPLPDMLDPISQAYKDRMDSRMQEVDKKRDDKSMGLRMIAPKMMGPKKKDGMKKGGMVKCSASKRADGCAQRGKTRGKMV